MGTYIVGDEIRDWAEQILNQAEIRWKEKHVGCEVKIIDDDEKLIGKLGWVPELKIGVLIYKIDEHINVMISDGKIGSI